MRDFEEYRPFLMSLSYRMMGSFSEAEDIVQEVAIKWLSEQESEIENTKAWLVRVTTNQAIDALRKAYRKREVYTGTWLPELLPDSMMVWENSLETKESLRASLLIILENLNPKERATYILREAFSYSFSEIGECLASSEASCRKIFQRAKKKIDEQDRRYDLNDEKSYSTIENFFKAASLGKKEEVCNYLNLESRFLSDGGGKVSAAKAIVSGPLKIAHFFASIFSSLKKDSSNYRFDYTAINGRPGVVISKKDESGLWDLETIFSFEFSAGKISGVFAQRNPDKLNFLAADYFK